MSDIKNAHIQGNLSITANTSNIGDHGAGILFTDFLQESTEFSGIKLLNSSFDIYGTGLDSSVLNLTNDLTETSQIILNGSANVSGNGIRSLTVVNNSGDSYFQSKGDLGIKVTETTGDVTVQSTTESINSTTASLVVQGGASINKSVIVDKEIRANDGYHIFHNTGVGESTVQIRNTSVSGYSVIDFKDSGDTTRLQLGYGNSSTSSPFTSQAYLQSSSGSLLLRSNSTDSILLETDGSVEFKHSTASTSYTTGAITSLGGIAISNTTDATGIGNGGALTIAGGISAAKKLFVGTDTNLATLSGVTTVGSSTAATFSATGALTIANTTASTSTITGALQVSGGVGIAGTVYANSGNFVTLTAPHSGLTGLLNDNHTQYVLLVGRSGGQIIRGGTAASNNLTIRSTSNATKGRVLLDETTTSTSTTTGALVVSGGVGIAGSVFVGGAVNLASGSGVTTIGSSTTATFSAAGLLTINNATASTSSTTGALQVLGGIGINNTTDAVSSSNGGTITSAGGMAIAKKAFIGTDLSVGGTTLLSNYFQTINITAPGNPPASNIRFYTDSADSLLKSKNSSGVVTTYQPTTTKGDLQSHNGTTQVRVPVGLNNTYLISDSSQTAGIRWGNLTNIYYVYDLKTTGTNGGSSVAGSWLQRTLNTIVAYPVGTTKVTLSGSNMIFQPGVYKITSSSPFSISNADIATRLYNVTNSTVSMISTTSHADSKNAIWYSYIYGILTVTSTTTYRIEYRTDKASANGLGIASGFHEEIYTHLEIQLIEYNV